MKDTYKLITKRDLGQIANEVITEKKNWSDLSAATQSKIAQAVNEGYLNKYMFYGMAGDDEIRYEINHEQPAPFSDDGIKLLSTNWYTDLRNQAWFALLVDLGTVVIAVAGLIIAILKP